MNTNGGGGGNPTLLESKAESKVKSKTDSIKIAESIIDSNIKLPNIESNEKQSQDKNSNVTESNLSDTNENIIELDEINVVGTKLSNDKKVFSTPGAISSREGIMDSTQSLDSNIRSIPGAYTQIDQSQGGISINIRSMTGLGRVNTMVDGVTQTFYGTSEDSTGSNPHPGGGTMAQTGSSAFGAMIDSNFLVGVDITRGSFSGASGSNALMGSANLRTIGVDDVLGDNKYAGFLGKFSYGDNGIGPSYMGAIAGKYRFLKSGFIGSMYAYSGKNITQDYLIGGGQNIGSPNDTTMPPPFNVQRLSQSPQSHLAKLELALDSNNILTLQYRRYDTHLAGRQITGNNYQLNYRYKSESNFIDLKILLAYNLTTQDFDKDFTWGTLSMDKYFSYVGTKNHFITFDINNTNLFEFNKDLGLELTYGFNYSFNKYTKDILRHTENMGGAWG